MSSRLFILTSLKQVGCTLYSFLWHESHFFCNEWVNPVHNIWIQFNQYHDTNIDNQLEPLEVRNFNPTQKKCICWLYFSHFFCLIIYFYHVYSAHCNKISHKCWQPVCQILHKMLSCVCFHKWIYACMHSFIHSQYLRMCYNLYIGERKWLQSKLFFEFPQVG